MFYYIEFGCDKEVKAEYGSCASGPANCSDAEDSRNEESLAFFIVKKGGFRVGMVDPLYFLLRDTSLELVRHRRLQELLPDILRRAQEFVGADVAYMALRDDSGDVMRVAYYRGTIRELPTDYFIRQGEGVSGQAWVNGCIVVVEDYAHYRYRLHEPYWASMRSAMGVPLFVGGMVWGALILAHTSREKKYSTLEIEGTEELASFASLAIENARIIEASAAEIERRKAAERAVKQNEARYRTVLAKSVTAMCSADPDSLQVLEANREFLKLCGYSLREVLSLTLYDLVSHDRVSVEHTCKVELTALKVLPPIAAALLRNGGDTVEVEFRMQLIRLAERKIIFITIRDLSEHRENKFLKVLQETSVDILQRKDRAALLRTLLRRSVELVSAKQGLLWMVTEDGLRIAPHMTVGWDAPDAWFQTRRGEGLVGEVWEKGLSLVTNNYLEWTHRLPEPKDHNVYAVAGFPLTDSTGQVIGVLELADTDPHRAFDRQECHYLGQMAQMVALELENTALLEAAHVEIVERGKAEQQIRQAYDALDQTYENTLIGWARALDMRDGETQNHSQRVADMTLKLAKIVGLPQTDWIHVWRGALLHDIGKVGIPDSILLHPGPLGKAEWTVMRRHPLYGVEWVERIDHLKPAISLIRHHHERWDGSGYPDGLKGEAIPLAARIFSIVDVWDALLSRRPYRDAWTMEQTLQYLQENAGRQFDPELTRIFLRRYRELL